MNCGQTNPLLDLNWNHTMDASGHYKSPPSSGISSSQPSSSATAADSMAFHKLMGGLQSIGNSDNGMAQPPHQLGAYLNSPPKLNLSMMGHFHHHQQQGMGVPMPLVHLDQFSDFNVRNDNRITTQFGVLDANKLSRVGRLLIGLPQGRNETFVAGGLQLGINNVELANGREESSVSDPAASGDASLGHPTGSNAKKRRAPPKGKVKEASIVNSSVDPPKVIEGEEASAKRSRSGNESDTVKTKIEQHDGCSSNGNGSQKQGKDSTVKAPEPPKDYIHVRARRGQATDSHSLAERVRREKISQRMKLLQDLVPGCNKVTGKAVMLDEIINYVQSLQRQVEFLSMKLATVNPHLDFSNVANLLPKDMQQACGPMSNSVYSLETSEFTPPYINQPQHGTSLHGILPNALENQNSMNLLDSAVHHNLNTHHSFITGFGSAPSQIGGFWEDDLQNSTHMDIEQN